MAKADAVIRGIPGTGTTTQPVLPDIRLGKRPKAIRDERIRRDIRQVIKRLEASLTNKDSVKARYNLSESYRTLRKINEELAKAR